MTSSSTKKRTYTAFTDEDYREESYEAPAVTNDISNILKVLNESTKHLSEIHTSTFTQTNDNVQLHLEAYVTLIPQLIGEKSRLLEQAKRIDTLVDQIKLQQHSKIMSTVLHDPDIMADHIFPFLGVGKFAFVAAVSKDFKDNYMKFVTMVALQHDPPSAHSYVAINPNYRSNAKRPTAAFDTFHSAAFSSVSCAEFWDNDTKKNQERHNKVCTTAAKTGSLAVLQWAQEKGFLWDTETCMRAAENGHLELLKWAHKNGCPWDGSTCALAAKYGQMEVLKWAHENGCPWDKNTCEMAAVGGHLDILKWARENGCPWDSWTSLHAAEYGDLEVLKWCFENGCPMYENICNTAAALGHLEIMKYAHEKGCRWDAETSALAALYGNLDILKWAHANGCPWNETACEFAAQTGRLEILKWAHYNGCPWNARTCGAAARYGHLEVLKWASENGCPEWEDEYVDRYADY